MKTTQSTVGHNWDPADIAVQELMDFKSRSYRSVVAEVFRGHREEVLEIFRTAEEQLAHLIWDEVVDRVREFLVEYERLYNVAVALGPDKVDPEMEPPPAEFPATDIVRGVFVDAICLRLGL